MMKIFGEETICDAKSREFSTSNLQNILFGFLMKKIFFAFTVFLLALKLSACATPSKMAFTNDEEKLSDKPNPVLLMTASIKNTYKTSFQPKLVVVHVEKPDAKIAADRFSFIMDDKRRNETELVSTKNRYLIRLELQPGQYEIRGLTSRASTFPVHGVFFTPMHSPLTVKEPGVFYLGHVEATVRERQGDEFKAGPSIPLIDQAVAGASGGTFEVNISDDWAIDESLFRSNFHALTGAKIQKAILPPFDRARAQTWWEEN